MADYKHTVKNKSPRKVFFRFDFCFFSKSWFLFACALQELISDLRMLPF
jgi:hypothetical protein